ncbi:hypothetical protein GGH12_005959 [Coemansia sp. RSA 1822]|nr:hypothetical protein IW147_006260 [Coemansia sp. RSA 720]KAJ2537779.1 hypothetical protein GGF49_006230 [Coemansia sp. RSA 1853]KAJ2558190.1 hypothetical protein GGH12_005959 [Coemansia sp. RSA 1822]
MVEEILEMVSFIDNDSSGLTSTLRKWHAQSLEWRKKAVPSPTNWTTEEPQLPDPQPGISAERAGPAAPAADAQAPLKEPDFAAVVVGPPSPSEQAPSPPTKKALVNQGQQRTSVRQNDPPAKAPSSPLQFHQVWIKGLVPKRISKLKKKLFDDHFILREIHNIIFSPGR